ncbi:uncharacterized protein RJT21DRAFT_3115 [Scheffersomyces amazonensis]|uniref:uncharacterized protein n=1 Tax=Scheffersomyces amazonensis TaxID=1078765 RepID=UPI00315DDEB1
MKLSSIINFKDAKAVLLSLKDGAMIKPFQISRQGMRQYQQLRQELNTYLENPNQEEINQMFKSWNLIDIVQDRHLDQSNVLILLLRLYNFHLMSPFEMEVDPNLYKVIEKFNINFISRIWVKEDSDLKNFLSDYFRFTTILNVRVVKPEPEVLNNSSKAHAPSSNSTTRTNESRNHSLKNIMGCLYPSTNKPEKFKMSESTFRFTKKQISSTGSLFTPQFSSIADSEARIELLFHSNVLTPVSDLLSAIYGERVSVNPKIRFEKQINSVPVHVIPDFAVTFQQLNIPIEIKKKKVLSNLEEFNARDIMQPKNSNLIEMFSQLIRESILVGCPFVLLSDYHCTLLIDLEQCKVGKYVGLNFCKILREVNCRIISLNDDDDGNGGYTLNTKVIMFMMHAWAKRNKWKPIMKKFEKKLLIQPNIRSSLMASFYASINECNDFLRKKMNKGEDNPAHTDSSFLSDTSIIENPDLQADDQVFSQYYIRCLNNLYKKRKYNGKRKTTKWKNFTLHNFQKEYKLLEIVSGDRINSRVSITFIVERNKDKRKFFLKLLDPIRSSIFTTKSSVLEGSYKRTFDIFVNEVSSYLRLKNLKNGIPQLHYFGFFNNSGSVNFTEFLTLKDRKTLNPNINLAGFFLLTEYIIGVTVNQISQPEREKIYPKAKNILNEINKYGVFHLDIHEENIIITKKKGSKEMVPVFVDFGKTKLAEERKRWKESDSKMSTIAEDEDEDEDYEEEEHKDYEGDEGDEGEDYEEGDIDKDKKYKMETHKALRRTFGVGFNYPKVNELKSKLMHSEFDDFGRNKKRKL